MTQEPMDYAVVGEAGRSDNVNNLIGNVRDLNSRVEYEQAANAAQYDTIDTLESEHATFDDRINALYSATNFPTRDGGAWYASSGTVPDPLPTSTQKFTGFAYVIGGVPRGIRVENQEDFIIETPGLWAIDMGFEITYNTNAALAIWLGDAYVDQAWAYQETVAGPLCTQTVRRFDAGDAFSLYYYLSPAHSVRFEEYYPTVHAYRVGD